MRLSSFLIATLALNLAPGPDMTYVAARSLGQGRRAGLISALGITAGCLFHVAAAAAGVAVVLRAWPHAYSVVQLVGSGYLLYLGLTMWIGAGRGDGLAAVADASEATIFRQGVITNVLNPKVGVFFLAFLPQFVAPGRGSAGVQMLALGLVFNTSGTLVNAAVAWLAGSARALLQSGTGRAWFQRVSGAILVALGLRLALARLSW